MRLSDVVVRQAKPKERPYKPTDAMMLNVLADDRMKMRMRHVVSLGKQALAGLQTLSYGQNYIFPAVLVSLPT